jgi:hypothetical protein
MSRTLGFAILALAFTQAAAELPAPESLPQAFAAFISKNEELANGKAVPYPDESYDVLEIDYRSRRELLGFAVPLSMAKPKSVDARPYRQALAAALHSGDPAVRGVACLVAGRCYDLELLPHLGALLDDDLPSLAVQGGMPQQAAAALSGISAVTMVRPKVRTLAKQAVEKMIGIGFASKQDFVRWMAGCHPIQHKRWYWESKWAHLWDDELEQLAFQPTATASRAVRPTVTTIDAEFDALPTEVALRLLSWFPGATRLEFRDDLGIAPRSVVQSDVREADATFRPKAEEIASYIVRNKLAGRLMAVLEDGSFGKGPVSDGTAALARMAANAGRWVFGPSSDTRLARAQAQPYMGDVAENIAITRSYLSPGQALDILTAYVSSVPKADNAARELASRFGSQGEAALISYYQNADGWYRTRLTADLLQAARSQVQVSKAFLLKLIEIPVPQRQAHSDDSLANIAETANIALGREAIGPLDIEAARYKQCKASAATIEAMNAGRPEALAKLKGLLEELLRK